MTPEAPNYEVREVTAQLLTAVAGGDPELLRKAVDLAHDHPNLADTAQQLAAVAVGAMVNLAGVTGRDPDEVLRHFLLLVARDG